jgi:hypothetical protein
VEAQHIDLTGAADPPREGTHESESVRVTEIDLPYGALAHSTLERVDYTDCFLLECPSADEQRAEEWARALLEGAPAATRAMLRRGWFALGVRLGSTDDERLVLGWAIRRSSDEHVVLAARSVFGFDAELLVRCEPRATLFATMLELRNPLVRAFWSGFSFQHRHVVRHLMVGLGRRVREGSAGVPARAGSR